MNSFSRLALSLLVALVMCFGAVSLVGCGGSSSASSAASASEQAASTEAADTSNAASDEASDEENSDGQDNCYGDDLPAVKSSGN